ncbi:hypothetical protein RND81_09G234300 [Saponaria officinalis]|uniref:Uncharacterized protein n=1 Tax=Saponaria officinalis TaxID=3572 RepID=A0AAW1IQR7_SAPOF
MKVKRGYMTVQICIEEKEEIYQKFEIPINFLNNPLFMDLLDKAREVYGYHVDGPLKLPCSIDDFLDLRWRIEMENSSCRSRRFHHYQPLDHHFDHDHDHDDDNSVRHTLSFRSSC